MREFIITALAIFVSVYGYSQDYLPLTGGTLTGPVNGTTASFNSYLTAQTMRILQTNSDLWDMNTGANTLTFSHHNNTSWITAFQLKRGGNATFFGSLTGTSATFSNSLGIGTSPRSTFNVVGTHTGGWGIATIESNNSAFLVLDAANNDGGLRYKQSGADKWLLGPRGEGSDFILANASDSHILNISQAGNVNFQGTLTCPSATFSGATNLATTSGSVGVGTNDPKSLLHLYGSVYSQFQMNNSGTGNAVNDGFRMLMDGLNVTVTNREAGYMAFETSDAEKMWITSTGNVAIGTVDPQGYKLAVAGNVIAESVKVELQGTWPDYVFKPGNKLLSLPEVETYVKENNHLPEMPSEAEVKKEGINLGQMDAKLLKKIEELTLYMIDFKKEMEGMKAENKTLKDEVAQLKANK